jgi:hypothetical protein
MCVGDQDWLDKGHGGGEGLQPMIKGSTRRVADRVSIRSVLRGDVAKPRKSRRRTKALVGWLLYCCTAVGGTAAAFTVRDTLFPSLGAPTKSALWASGKPDTTPTTEHGSTSTAGSVTAAAEITVPTTTATSPAPSVEAPTVPSVSAAGQGPSNTVDNHGPTNATVPQTGTTVGDNPSAGPGPGTTVDDHGTDPSTPSSASTPPSGQDPTPTPASTPIDPTGSSTPGGQNGKGNGGGGGGDSGGGDGGDADPQTP